MTRKKYNGQLPKYFCNLSFGKKRNPFNTLQEIYDWIRAHRLAETGLLGIVKEPFTGEDRLVEVWLDEYEFRVPHFTLELSCRPPKPIAKIMIPDKSFLKDEAAGLQVLWTREGYQITPEQLAVLSAWLRRPVEKHGGIDLSGIENLKCMQMTWDSYAESAWRRRKRKKGNRRYEYAKAF
jgi:hypothetical protein